MSPHYEYECVCGLTFDRFLPINSRHDVLCSCGGQPQIKIGKVFNRMARPFKVFDHDGTLLHQRQTITKTPPMGYVEPNPSSAFGV